MHFRWERHLTRCQLDTIYIDCAKAFDNVNHQILLDIFVEFNFSRNVFLFVRNYISSRSQVVRIGGYYSQAFTATSDAPQGSNLGPLLFLMFINDLPNSAKSSDHLIFEDILKIFQNISSDKDYSD